MITLCRLQGYALVEYETMAEAQAAIDSASGSTLLDQMVQCDYAFIRPPPSGPRKGRGGRERSASPRRKDEFSYDFTDFNASFKALGI